MPSFFNSDTLMTASIVTLSICDVTGHDPMWVICGFPGLKFSPNLVIMTSFACNGPSGVISFDVKYKLHRIFI